MLISHISSDTVWQSVTLRGWIDKIRSSGKVAFVALRDGSGFIQCVIEPGSVGQEAFDELITCGLETSLEIV